jgi:cytochrome c5
MRAIRLTLLLTLAMTHCPAAAKKPNPQLHPASPVAPCPPTRHWRRSTPTVASSVTPIPAANAPLTGDRKAWEPRIRQGTDTLLDHAINGYNGMPPMGQCVECSEEQFLQLIGFMADQPLPE